MPVKIVNGIVGSADQGYSALFDNAACAHGRICKLFVAKFPYFLCVFGGEVTMEIKVTLKLQVTPMIKRVADSFFKTLSPLDELVMI